MSAGFRILSGMGNELPPALRAIAAAQAGVVSRRQVLRAGIPATTITSKLQHGRWQHLHQGVYSVTTGTATWAARLWAAVLYAGAGAMLSHETAAEVLGLTDRRHPVIQVTIPVARRVKPPQGVRIWLSCFDYPRWPPLQGLPPYTFYADTIVDLAAAADSLDDVVGWVSRGVARRLVTEAQLRAAVAARGRLRWRGQLDEVIGQVAGGSHFPLEYRYDRDVERAHGLPASVKQAKFVKADGTRGFRDRCYAKYGLVVELDGKEFHLDEHRNRDRGRDNEAVVTTGATLRYGWADVERNPCATARQVHAALRGRGYCGIIRACEAGCQAVLAALRGPVPVRDLAQGVQFRVGFGPGVLLSHVGAELHVLAHRLAEGGIFGQPGLVQGLEIGGDEPRPLLVGDLQVPVQVDQVLEPELSGEPVRPAEGLGGEPGQVVHVGRHPVSEQRAQDGVGQCLVVKENLKPVQSLVAASVLVQAFLVLGHGVILVAPAACS
jgi:hypothetical protein